MGFLVPEAEVPVVEKGLRGRKVLAGHRFDANMNLPLIRGVAEHSESKP